jgi:hypothetical protein
VPNEERPEGVHERLGALHGTLQPGRATLGERRRRPVHDRGQGRERMLDAAVAPHGTQRRHEQPAGDREGQRGVELDRTRGADGHPGAAPHLLQRPEQARLARPGRALHQHDGADRADDRLHRLLQRGKLAVAFDEVQRSRCQRAHRVATISGASSVERVAPAQAGELREVAIEADSLAPVLEREGGVMRVGDQRAARLGAAAEVHEDRPVAIAGTHDSRVGATAKAVGEPESSVERGGNVERPRVRRDTDETAQHQLGDGERRG